VLLGTDYNAPILPPKRALLAAMDPLVDSSSQLAGEDAKAALEIFHIHNGPLNVNIQNPRGHFEAQRLRAWLLEIGMIPSRIDNTLSKLSQKLGSGSGDAVVSHSMPDIISQNLHIHGYPGCSYFTESVSIAINPRVIEVPRDEWSTHVAALNAELGTHHKTSPYIFADISGHKVFIGGCDNLKSLMSGKKLI
jgi:glutaredoxin